MSFLNIAFEAEISRYEDVEFADHARRNCNEQLDTKAAAIAELRRIINDGDAKVRRTDDAYLLRFLRARRFAPTRSYRLMLRYEEFRKKNAYLYKDIDPFNMRRTYGIYEGVIPDSPDNGRIIIMNLGKWNPKTISIDELTQVVVAVNEICIMQPKIQVLGATVIMDLEGLSLSQVRCFTPAMAKQMVSLLGLAFPVQVHGIHVVNYSWILNTALYLFKPFIPADAWGLVHFHGSDLSALHQHIETCYLPNKYGGTCKHVVPTDLYLEKINKYKDEFLGEELKALGYNIK